MKRQQILLLVTSRIWEYVDPDRVGLINPGPMKEGVIVAVLFVVTHLHNKDNFKSRFDNHQSAASMQQVSYHKPTVSIGP